jgi:hypothetical protein
MFEYTSSDTGEQPIDFLVRVTEPIQQVVESSADIEEVNCVHNNKPGCLKCKLCGKISGTSRELQHTYKCKYSTASKEISGPFQVGKVSHTDKIDSSKSVGILQREYGIVNNETPQKIIGTYGAGPCVILCMRNRETYDTILAHIDSLTTDPLSVFSTFQPDKCDVYIIGGDSSSDKELHDILITLKQLKYKITFAYIQDNSRGNSFAINCITGETYINDDINPMVDLPLVYDIKIREIRMRMIYMLGGALEKVNIRQGGDALRRGRLGGMKSKKRKSKKRSKGEGGKKKKRKSKKRKSKKGKKKRKSKKKSRRKQ